MTATLDFPIAGLVAGVQGIVGRVTALGVAVVATSTIELELQAKQTVPVRTGFLRDSIHHDFLAGGLVSETGPDALYGDYVERGTSRMAPQPYMSPSLDAITPMFYAAAEAAAARALDA